MVQHGSKKVYAEFAPQYFQKQLSALPIEPGTKRPTLQNWQGYCDNVPNPTTQQQLIQDFGSCGVGLALGREILSDYRLCCIDIDWDAISRPVAALLGSTACAKRGAKGISIFALSQKGLKSRVFKNAEGKHAVDVLIGGRQTVLPPTVHPETHAPYIWVGTPLLEMPFEALPRIDARKLQLLELLVAANEIGTLAEGEGTHDAALRLVAKLVSAGATDQEVESVILACLPQDYLGNTLDELEGFIQSARIKGFDSLTSLPLDEGVARQVADHLAPLVYVDGDGFRRYQNGYWPQYYQNDIDRAAKELLIDRLRKGGQVASYLRNVRQCLLLNSERRTFGEHSSYLCFRNGTLDVLTGELAPHSPAHELRYRLDFDYDPHASCPRYDKHAQYTFCNDQQRVDLFDEFAGLTLVADMNFQKALYLVGPGGSGKSTLLKLLRAVHGSDAVSATPLERLNDERYLADVVRKQVCINFDVQTDKPVFGEAFMRITGGDPVAIRLLYREVEGLVVPTVRFIGSMNTDMPRPAGAPDALARRLIMLECNNKVAMARSSHGDELMAELPGIIVKWTKAVRRLYNRGEFDIPHSSTTLVNAFLFECEPFDTFFTEFLEVDDSARTLVSDIHTAFNAWAIRNGEKELSSNVVGRKLRRFNVRGGFMRHSNGEESRTARSVGVRFRVMPSGFKF